MGSLDAEGYLYLADRKSDMLIVGGANVYPAEVESALMEHPAVRTAVVIALPHEDLGQVPHALLELEGDVTDEELRAHLDERLASYKIPRTFERVSEPLRDDAGKVRRVALAAARTERPRLTAPLRGCAAGTCPGRGRCDRRRRRGTRRRPPSATRRCRASPREPPCS